jgi:hypothetical protein
MQITITTDQGVVVDVIENVEEWNLDKPLARSALMDVIEEIIERGKRMIDRDKSAM